MKPGDLIVFHGLRLSRSSPQRMLGVILSEEKDIAKLRFFTVLLQNGERKLIHENFLELV